MKSIFSIILILSILLTVCSGVYASETALNLNFSDWSGSVPHQTAVKYNNKNIVSFFKGTTEGNSIEIGENGPYGNYYKSVAVGDNASNVIYTFPGKDFASRTLKYVGISYVVRNTNTNRFRSNIRPSKSPTNSSTTFYEWENNILKPVSNNQIVAADYQITMDPSKYYNFTIIINLPERKWKLFIDGEYIGEYSLFENANLDWSEGYYYVTFQNFGKNGQDGEVHFDEYKVTFLDDEGIDIYPFAEIVEDGSYASSINPDALTRKVLFHVVNNSDENKNLTVMNPSYIENNGFLIMNNYKIFKKSIIPGYNGIEFNSLNIPSEDEISKLYFWEQSSLKSIKGFDVDSEISEEVK